jgi:hypothetical protein
MWITRYVEGRAAVLCRTRHGYPLADGLEAVGAGELA